MVAWSLKITLVVKKFVVIIKMSLRSKSQVLIFWKAYHDGQKVASRLANVAMISENNQFWSFKSVPWSFLKVLIMKKHKPFISPTTPPNIDSISSIWPFYHFLKITLKPLYHQRYCRNRLKKSRIIDFHYLIILHPVLKTTKTLAQSCKKGCIFPTFKDFWLFIA